MNDFFVCQIRNNSLGASFRVMSYDDGVDDIIEWAEDHLGRKLTEDEIEGIRANGEFYDDSDFDNHCTFSIGVLA
jgi:hypothetical protein